jgi:hypothetical protein
MIDLYVRLFCLIWIWCVHSLFLYVIDEDARVYMVDLSRPLKQCTIEKRITPPYFSLPLEWVMYCMSHYIISAAGVQCHCSFLILIHWGEYWHIDSLVIDRIRFCLLLTCILQSPLIICIRYSSNLLSRCWGDKRSHLITLYCSQRSQWPYYTTSARNNTYY